MGLIFREPVWLLTILLAVPTAWVGLLWFRTMSRWRALLAVALRSVLIALLSMVLAGAASVSTSDRLAVIALVDVSGSVRQFADFGLTPEGAKRTPADAVRDWLDMAASKRGPDDLLGVVIFDGDSLALASPAPPSRAMAASGKGTDSSEEPLPDGRTSAFGWRIENLPLDISLAEGTDIAGAIRFATALFPPDARRRLLLISDGNTTSGDAMSAAFESASLQPGEADLNIAANAIPIDVLPIAYNVRNETMIDFVDAPPQAARESLITIRVGLSATQPTGGTLRLMREGIELDVNGAAPGSGLHVDLAPGRQVIPLTVRTPPESVHRFRAVFEPDDASADSVVQNNKGDAFTITPGRGRILVVDGVGRGAPTGPGAILPDTLRRAGLDIDVVPPGAIPMDLLSMQAYDLVILHNVSAEFVPQSIQSMLASYVRDLGGGLVMVGGADSFGAGGWNGGPIEEVLPVEMDLPEDLIIPSAAIVIVLDSSGSMRNRILGGMRTQQEIANEAAALAIQTLDPKDLVGVLEFNTDYHVVAPLGPNSDPETSAARVRAIAPDGGTNLYPALFEAGEMLRKANAQVKRIIVLSDGVSSGSPEYGRALAARLAIDNINVTTIAVGDGADTETLAGIAAAGGGAFYEVVDPNLLPQIFIREVRIVRKPMIREAVFQPRLTAAGSPITAGLPAPLPTLGGYVLTQPKPDTTAIDAILAPSGEPILAHWNIGLGQAAAWTSDASRWARAWINTPAYDMLWTQMARIISRPASNQQYDVRVETRDGVLRIRLDAADDEGNPLDLLTIPGWVYTPSGSRLDLSLSQTGPGVYEAEMSAPETGAYITALTPRLGPKRLSPIVAGASSATSPEFSRLQSNIARLRELSEATGGRILSWHNAAEFSPSGAGGTGVGVARLSRAVDSGGTAPRAESDVSPDMLFDRTGVAPTRAMTPLLPTLLAWSVVVLLLDVGARRIAWDRLFSRELAAELRLHAAARVRERGVHATTTLGQLRRRASAKASGGRSSRALNRDREGAAPPQNRDHESAIPLADPIERGSPSGFPPPGRTERIKPPREDGEQRRAIRDALRASRQGVGGTGVSPVNPGASTSGPPASSPYDSESKKSAPSVSKQVSEDGAASLLAAKRRVRERLNKEHDATDP